MFQRSRSAQTDGSSQRHLSAPPRHRTGPRRFVISSFVFLSFLGAVGCDFTDLFSDDFLIGLGIDSSLAPTAATGTIIVTYSNNTSYIAVMRFMVEEDAQRVPDGTGQQQYWQHGLDTGESANLVFDCPTDRITPGLEGLRTDNIEGEVTTSAATIYQVATADDGTTEVTQVEVAYGGSALLSGRDYQCGDVISITVSPQAVLNDSDVPFHIFVQVLPGS